MSGERIKAALDGRPTARLLLRLKPQDIVVALKLVVRGAAEWTQPELARSLHLSASEVNHGLKRLAACHLFNVRERRVIRAGLSEFLGSGLRYVFPAQLGLLGQGMPTAFSIGPLAQKLRIGAKMASYGRSPARLRPLEAG